MRLRWESAVPVQAAAWLGDVLALPVAAKGDHHEVDFANAVLEIRQPQRPDRAGGDDRLWLVDESAPGDRAPTARVPHSSGDPPLTVVAVGIATVDMDRFAAAAGWAIQAIAQDRVLGASSARVIGHPFVLLEPNTEGRVAASLARLGEGPVAIYVTGASGLDLASVGAAMAARRVRMTATALGPFGLEFAIAARRAWGPHVVVCDSAAPAAGTIAP